MPYKILIDYGAAEGWKVGDVVDITNAERLIKEGKVEEVTGELKKAKPVVEETGAGKPKKDYICEVCGYVANTGAGLKSHVRKHSA